MNITQKTLLYLVNVGLEPSEGKKSLDWFGVVQDALKGEEWMELFDLSERQGISAIALDGLHSIVKHRSLVLDGFNLKISSDPQLVYRKFQWLGLAMQMEQMYAEHEAAIASLAKFYGREGVRLMVLKGYGLSLNYPHPNHRPTGDVDTYNFGLQKFADEMLIKKTGIAVDNSHHHHSVFTWKGVMFENHYDFINQYAHRNSKKIEAKLKELADKDVQKVRVGDDGVEIYLPSPQFNALFLVRHCAAHFSSIGLSLRQLLDWLLFVKRFHDQVDWQKAYIFYKEHNLMRFVNSMNAIGAKYLGFGSVLNGLEQKIGVVVIEKDEALVERMLNDILSPEFTEREDGSLRSGLWVKPRRWWHNRWKHRITYPDSLLVGFLWTLCSKIMKPSHFLQ